MPCFRKVPVSDAPFLCLLAFPFDSFRRLWDNAGGFIISGHGAGKRRKAAQSSRGEGWAGTFGYSGGCCPAPRCSTISSVGPQTAGSIITSQDFFR